MQVTLLVLMSREAVPLATEKKRKRSSKDAVRSEPSPIDDPTSTLELLMDRLGVWNAVAELGIVEAVESKSNEDRGLQVTLRRFWQRIMLPK